MPPLHGPRALLCCTRKPWKTLSEPSSILMGRDRVSARRGERNTSRRPGCSLSFSAAASNCRMAIRKGLRSSVVSATVLVAMGWVTSNDLKLTTDDTDDTDNTDSTRQDKAISTWQLAISLCLKKRLVRREILGF